MRNINQTIDFMTLRDDKERVKTSREELGKFFYGLANATFIGMVIGGMISVVTKSIDEWSFIILFTIGVIGTLAFALVANVILKNK